MTPNHHAKPSPEDEPMRSAFKALKRNNKVLERAIRKAWNEVDAKKRVQMGKALYHLAGRLDTKAIEKSLLERHTSFEHDAAEFLRGCASALGFSTIDDHIEDAFEKGEFASIPPLPTLTSAWRAKYLRDKTILVMFALDSHVQAFMVPYRKDNPQHYLESADHLMRAYHRFLGYTRVMNVVNFGIQGLKDVEK